MPDQLPPKEVRDGVGSVVIRNGGREGVGRLRTDLDGVARVGGIVRAGSKVGAKKYKNMIASTNDAYCPTLRGRSGVETQLPADANSVLEIVIDGLDRAAIEDAMRVGLAAACRPGVVEITAGNYGGKLGKHHFHLHQLAG